MTPLIWIIVGIALILIELATTGFVAVFFGCSAIVTGLALWLGLPAYAGLPYGLFAALSIGQIVFLRHRLRGTFAGDTKDRASDSTYDDFIGHEATVLNGLAEPGSRGQVDYRGTSWAAVTRQGAGPVGSAVTIKARESACLVVEA